MLKIQLCSTGIHYISKYVKIEINIINFNSLKDHNITGFIFLYFDQINTALMSICDSIKKTRSIIF